MNWLAHAFLSKDEIEYQLGNILADPIKGKPWEGASASLQEGLKMHINIDTFTDCNSYVSQSKQRLGEKGYLRGVVIDITYDHLLLNHWERYASVELEEFMQKFYAGASEVIPAYPDDPRRVIERLIRHETLTSYKSFEGLERALKRIDYRLSDRVLSKDSALSYMPILEKEMSAIEGDFHRFFPQLVDHFKSHASFDTEKHWFI